MLKQLACASSTQQKLHRNMFLFYSAKLNSMAWSLESLLAKRRDKKNAPICRFINHNLTDNSSKGKHQVLSNSSHNDTSSNNTHYIHDSTNPPITNPKRKRCRRKTKPARFHLDHSSVINLSRFSLTTNETFVLSRGLTFCPTLRHINKQAESFRRHLRFFKTHATN